MRAKLAVVIVGLLVTLGTFLMAVRTGTGELQRATDFGATFVELSSVEDDFRQGASVELEWTGPTEMTTTLPAGTITEVILEPLTSYTEGAPLLRVDRVLVLLHTGVPFHRDISWGSSGQDVMEMRRVLSLRGAYDDEGPDLSSGDRFNAADFRAIVRLQDNLGVPAGRRDGRFSTNFVAYVDTAGGDLMLKTVSVRLGGAIGSEPVSLGFETSSLVSARVEPAGEDGRSVGLSGEPLLLAVQQGGTAHDVAIETLVVVESQQLAQIESLVDQDIKSIQAVVRLADPVERVNVPGVALVTMLDGRFCLLVGTSLDDLTAIVVNPSPSSIAGLLTLSRSEVEPGTPILANPHQIGMTDVVELCDS